MVRNSRAEEAKKKAKKEIAKTFREIRELLTKEKP